INPASKNRRSYWTNDASAGSESAEDWFAGAEEHPGSWWNDWIVWLNKLSGRNKVAARGVLGNERYRPIEPAPGRYVKQKATL
ncbi:MAG: class I poly(R)-hydroxyalkanoic acid synthase, partial [Rhodocyclaceae bacterium]|nr:class I poly(R)-hydroxyalkanoic acid synthase [Rhodocyclaceae bacterium]